jgi:hypothetical protein
MKWAMVQFYADYKQEVHKHPKETEVARVIAQRQPVNCLSNSHHVNYGN